MIRRDPSGTSKGWRPLSPGELILKHLIIITTLGWLVASCERVTHKIEGSVVLTDEHLNQECLPTGGYRDISPLVTQVTVTDQVGKIIGLGTLGSGVFTNKGFSGVSLYGKSCSFPFTIENVPEAEFYGIEISHRGTIRKSLAEMRDAGWTVGLSLGQ